MTSLTVFYDDRCGLCCAVREWIDRQAQLLRIDCKPSPHASAATDEIVIVADSGEMWTGDAAWLMVLWALRDYRDWAYRLSEPALLPIARTMFAQLSAYRGSLSCALGLTPETT